MFGRSRGRSIRGGSPDGLGLAVLHPPPGTSDEGALVDIVFVHGLGGSRYGTWKKDGVLWPQTLLAQDFPEARIMTVGDINRLTVDRWLCVNANTTGLVGLRCRRHPFLRACGRGQRAGSCQRSEQGSHAGAIRGLSGRRSTLPLHSSRLIWFSRTLVHRC